MNANTPLKNLLFATMLPAVLALAGCVSQEEHNRLKAEQGKIIQDRNDAQARASAAG